jgi:type VI secretion system secreted protein VgrG
MNRLFNLSSPFGDVLRFERLSGREAVSQLFEFELTASSEERGLAPTAALGQPFTVEFEVEGGGKRYLNGQCVAFRSVGRNGRKHLYTASLRPGLWYATRRSDYRIFQHKTVIDIVKEVLGAYPFAIKWMTAGSYSPWTYCVQYRETDANFVMRMLELEGLWFYFEHAAGEHTLVITDDIGLASPFPNYASIEFYPQDISIPDKDHLSFWADAGQVTSGKYIARDYNFVMPSADLETQQVLPGGHPHASYDIFDFPGEYQTLGEGLPFARVRMEELHAAHLRAACEGRARGVAPGRLFTLAKHAVGRYNREYLVLACDYQFADNDYEGSSSGHAVETHISAEVHPSDQPYRPARRTPKPLTNGPDSAVVTGPAGQEIHTDEYGRVKVQFHWDRYGKRDENSSCWIRVSHPWAGSGFGGVHIPRIGQEVIVDYLNGDPDQPLIVGRVYNTEQPHPWGLPAAATQSGFLTRSTLGGNYETANALRFEDKRGEEQVWLHAEKNQDIEVENDETHWVGRDRTKTIDRDETNHIKRDRTETVDHNETITVHNDRTEEVDGYERITIHKDRTEEVDGHETISIHKNRTETVDGNESVTVHKSRSKTIGKNESDKIGKSWSIKVGKFKTETIKLASMQNVTMAKMVNVGGAYSLNVGAVMMNITGMGRSDSTVKKHGITAGKSVAIDAGEASNIVLDEDGLRLVVGKSSLKIEKSGRIRLDGEKIVFNAKGPARFRGRNIKLDRGRAAMSKAERWAARQQQIADAKSKLAGMPPGPERDRLAAATERFELNNTGVEKARLAQHIYDPSQPAPEGWRDISNDSEALARYGLQPDQLSIPGTPSFRAGVYEPDPNVFGPNMRPSVVFQGTNPSSLTDWNNNLRQGLNLHSPYYERAVDIGRRVGRGGADVDIVGHSLGGGMASAASRASGAPGWTFNSAGLNSATVSRYGGTPITPANENIQAYQVAGEVLTGLQEQGWKGTAAAAGAGFAVGGVKGAVLGALAKLGLSAAMPDAVGNRLPLPGSGNPVARHGMDQVVDGIEAQKEADQAVLTEALQ